MAIFSLTSVLRFLSQVLKLIGLALEWTADFVEEFNAVDEAVFPGATRDPDWGPLFLLGLGIWVGVKFHYRFIAKEPTAIEPAAAPAA
jgi:hypothetical protein